MFNMRAGGVAVLALVGILLLLMAGACTEASDSRDLDERARANKQLQIARR